MDSQQLAQCASNLSASEDYQVLTRLKATTEFNTPTPDLKLHRACIIDTETTGLDTDACEILELGYQIVEFDSVGNLYRVLASKNFMNEPEGEISDEVTKITGITFEDVAGHSIPWEEVLQDLAQVNLCIAHNAGFDRPVLERYHDVFKEKIWGCSVAQIDWNELAHVSSRSQEFLCWKIANIFYGAHRALDDVMALTELLSQKIGEPEQPALGFLLKSVRIAKTLVKATGAPFDLKDTLKSRGYQWNAAERVWQRMMDDSQLELEEKWLSDNRVKPTLRKLKATDTFSVRAK